MPLTLLSSLLPLRNMQCLRHKSRQIAQVNGYSGPRSTFMFSTMHARIHCMIRQAFSHTCLLHPALVALLLPIRKKPPLSDANAAAHLALPTALCCSASLLSSALLETMHAINLCFSINQCDKLAFFEHRLHALAFSVAAMSSGGVL